MRKKNGFTLVELLVAVAVLAIIVTISFAIYNNYSKGAKEVAQKITMQNLANAAQMYAKEFKTNPDFWYQEVVDDVPTGNEFSCTTIKQLKNKGILQGKLVDATTNEAIDDDTTIKIIRDANKVITSKIEKDSLDCDKTPPELNIVFEGNLIGDWYTGEIKYTITPEYGYSGISDYNYYIEINGERTNLEDVDDKYVYSGTVNDDVSSDNIKVCAWAKNGNDIESETVCETVKLDNEPISKPTIKASDNVTSNNWHKNTFTLNISGGGNSLSGKYYEYRMDEKEETYNKVNDNKINIGTSDHNKTFYVRTCNNVGKCSDEALYKILIDKEPPTITNVSKSTSSYVSNLTIKATINDSLSGIAKYKINKSSSYNNTGWTNVNGNSNSMNINANASSNGIYYIWVEDKAGNYSKTSININNIATLHTVTVNLGDSSSRTVSGNKVISGIVALSSVTTNNGSVTNSYLSGNRVYFTVGNGSSTSVPRTERVTVSASSRNPSSTQSCRCDYGATLSGTMCIGQGGPFTNKQIQYWSCINNKWIPTDGLGVNDSNRSCQEAGYPYGYEKDISNYMRPYYDHEGNVTQSNCDQYVYNYSCNQSSDPVLKTRICYADCKKPDYRATCTSRLTCPSTYTLIGSKCYTCSRGSLNYSSKTCSYNTTVYDTVYRYTVTIKYYA